MRKALSDGRLVEVRTTRPDEKKQARTRQREKPRIIGRRRRRARRARGLWKEFSRVSGRAGRGRDSFRSLPGSGRSRNSLRPARASVQRAFRRSPRVFGKNERILHRFPRFAGYRVHDSIWLYDLQGSVTMRSENSLRFSRIGRLSFHRGGKIVGWQAGYCFSICFRRRINRGCPGNSDRPWRRTLTAPSMSWRPLLTNASLCHRRARSLPRPLLGAESESMMFAWSATDSIFLSASVQ